MRNAIWHPANLPLVFGRALRVKGFAPARDGWLELNATAAGQTLAPIPQGQDVLIVIGEGLDRARIETQLHR